MAYLPGGMSFGSSTNPERGDNVIAFLGTYVQNILHRIQVNPRMCGTCVNNYGFKRYAFSPVGNFQWRHQNTIDDG